ncbi:hypothetical protein [Mesorhizobium sp.]|uniref:hypothetical protein n=1 Tax=Mesorhizobium sp. TaxID=1871066 RepID=UPI00121488D9|nr:hypothetical protein [Mesorhizobium sp.]TIT02494.1 MAG: hypothetical protein E5W87_09750 [Mesorhizobium sp.]
MGERGDESLPEWLAGHLSDDPVIAGDISARIWSMKKLGLPSHGMRRSQRKDALIDDGSGAFEAQPAHAITADFPNATPIMLLAFLALSVLLLLGVLGSALPD